MPRRSDSTTETAAREALLCRLRSLEFDSDDLIRVLQLTTDALAQRIGDEADAVVVALARATLLRFH